MPWTPCYLVGIGVFKGSGQAHMSDIRLEKSLFMYHLVSSARTGRAGSVSPTQILFAIPLLILGAAPSFSVRIILSHHQLQLLESSGFSTVGSQKSASLGHSVRLRERSPVCLVSPNPYTFAGTIGKEK